MLGTAKGRHIISGFAGVGRQLFETVSPAGPFPHSLGPDLPFSPWPIAAVQLHQTGHSSIAQHFRRMKVGRAGPCCLSPRYQHSLLSAEA